LRVNNLEKKEKIKYINFSFKISFRILLSSPNKTKPASSFDLNKPKPRLDSLLKFI